MNLSYLAGFIDADGCIQFTKTRNSIYPRILIVNTNLNVLQEIQKEYGGDINEMYRSKENWKQCYQLRISWSKAVNLLSKIHRFLIVKQRQAEVVFAWDAVRLGKGNKCKYAVSDYKDACELLVKQMHWLNKRGINEEKEPILEELNAVA